MTRTLIIVLVYRKMVLGTGQPIGFDIIIHENQCLSCFNQSKDYSSVLIHKD